MVYILFQKLKLTSSEPRTVIQESSMTAQNSSLTIKQTITAPNWLSLSQKIATGVAKVWSAITGRSGHLLDLAAVQADCTLVDYSYIGCQTVPLRQIRGSASTSRCHDFDANFHPRHDHTASRWASIETARRQGTKLPPVSLIQVGDIYFVEDGHHRISVAKAYGEKTIEAEVTAWRVIGRLPWEQSPAAVIWHAQL
jgi:hypothetical protein